MTSTDTSWGPPGLTARRLPTATLERILLLCGVISSALFIATDIAGGLSYPGYDFTSQAISELMAVGAPSEPVVDPLFLVYDALIVAFGVGVLRAFGSRRPRLRLTGGLLIGYGVVGLTGPTLFEMHQRGTSNVSGDLGHIIVTGVIVLLTLVAITVAAFAFGPRFRRYSFATLAVMLVAGVISAPYGARLAAGEATPGFGIIERIAVYASLVWIAVFAIALLRHAQEGSVTMTTQHSDRPRHPRRVVFLAVISGLMLVLPVSAARAQVSELRAGAYVRMRAPGVVAGEVECTILARDRDTLRVARPGAAPMSVPLASITQAAVYRGRTRSAGARKGAKWGAGVGLGLGLFNIGFSDCSGEHCETSDNVAGVAAFTAVGAGIGALVGTVVRAERWERVELPPRVAAPAVAATFQWPVPR